MNLSIHHLHNLNHWALLVSALMLWILGAVWYSPPLFAKPWMALVQTPSGPSKRKSLIAGMISSFVCDLILSFVLWHVIAWSGADTWDAGALIGFLCWAGFLVCSQLPQGIYESRPFKLFAINNGYWLIGLAVAGALLAAWH